MCLGGSSSPPPIPAAPPPPPPIPQPLDPRVQRARKKNKQQAALAEGRNATILTSGLGLTTEATSAKKTLLGA